MQARRQRAVCPRVAHLLRRLTRCAPHHVAILRRACHGSMLESCRMAMQRSRSPAGRPLDDRRPVRLALSITPGRHLIVRATEADGEDPLAPEAAARIA